MQLCYCPAIISIKLSKSPILLLLSPISITYSNLNHQISIITITPHNNNSLFIPIHHHTQPQNETPPLTLLPLPPTIIQEILLRLPPHLIPHQLLPLKYLYYLTHHRIMPHALMPLLCRITHRITLLS
mgnify:CR=1 FL=1